MGNRRPTVREIAKIAQVSVATVSRVSRGTGQVSPEMRERVL
ncbi:LacI family DNA-binding transcriptional regulator, partial [Nonomuraea sp. NPDC055795]